MKSNKVLCLMLLSATFALGSCGNNESKTVTTDTTTTLGEKISAVADSAKAAMTPDPNKSFVTDAAPDNTKEIAWLQAGLDHGTSKELKAHAKMMLNDHKALADQLNGYASQKNITLPSVDTTNLVDLSEKPGKDWDKAWVNKMVDAHQDAIDKFEKAQGKVTDPDLKAMIDKTLPTLHSHYDMMKAMQDKMK